MWIFTQPANPRLLITNVSHFVWIWTMTLSRYICINSGVCISLLSIPITNMYSYVRLFDFRNTRSATWWSPMRSGLSARHKKRNYCNILRYVGVQASAVLSIHNKYIISCDELIFRFCLFQHSGRWWWRRWRYLMELFSEHFPSKHINADHLIPFEYSLIIFQNISNLCYFINNVADIS